MVSLEIKEILVYLWNLTFSTIKFSRLQQQVSCWCAHAACFCIALLVPFPAGQTGSEHTKLKTMQLFFQKNLSESFYQRSHFGAKQKCSDWLFVIAVLITAENGHNPSDKVSLHRAWPLRQGRHMGELPSSTPWQQCGPQDVVERVLEITAALGMVPVSVKVIYRSVENFTTPENASSGCCLVVLMGSQMLCLSLGGIHRF